MLLKFLGTSAGELYPGIWCRCRNCDQARKGEAKNRRQSAALYIEQASAPKSDDPVVAEGVLIDFPSEIVSQAERHGVELPLLQYLLVTHSHGDHWFPYFLRWRSRPAEFCSPGEPAPMRTGAPRFTDLPLLHIWGNEAVESTLIRELGKDLTPYKLDFHRIRSGASFAMGEFHVTALAANHDVGREEALHYVVQTGGKTLLYGLDGDTFLPKTREALRTFRFDTVIMESTYGLGDGKNHRNFERVIEEANWLREENLLKPEGRIIATHFSPHHSPPHEETCRYFEPHQIVTAYDGMEIRP